MYESGGRGPLSIFTRVTNYDWLEHNRYFMLHFHRSIINYRLSIIGHRAKYGTYTLVELSSNKIVDFQCVHISQAGNSNNMEKKGFSVLLEKMKEKDLSIQSIATDRHVQIRSVLSKDYPTIDHQFDVWHASKSIKKKLLAASHIKGCDEIGLWMKSIINHF